MLVRQGYTVLAASSGDEALRAAARYEGHIDLLLTDVVMPGMSGPELARRMTAGQPGLRLLFMTGYTDDAMLRHGLVDGVVKVLQKPFSQQEISAGVRAALDRAEAGSDAAVRPGGHGVLR